MPCELNRAVYEQLLREDLEWLLKQPRTLERDHIEYLLRWMLINNDEMLVAKYLGQAIGKSHDESV